MDWLSCRRRDRDVKARLDKDRRTLQLAFACVSAPAGACRRPLAWYRQSARSAATMTVRRLPNRDAPPRREGRRGHRPRTRRQRGSSRVRRGGVPRQPRCITPGRRIAQGSNRGRKFSNYIQDSTICASCRWTATASSVRQQRENRHRVAGICGHLRSTFPANSRGSPAGPAPTASPPTRKHSPGSPVRGGVSRAGRPARRGREPRPVLRSWDCGRCGACGSGP